MKYWHWGIAFLLALGIHGSLLVGFPRAQNLGAYSSAVDGDQGLEVGLGQLGSSYQDQLETRKPKPPVDVIEPEPLPEPPPVSKPQPVKAEPKPVLETVQTDVPPPEALTVKEPEPATAQEPVADTPKEPETAPEESTPATRNEKATAALIEADSNRDAKRQTTGTQQQQRSGGRKGNAKGDFP